jgi:hypothetical protein
VPPAALRNPARSAADDDAPPPPLPAGHGKEGDGQYGKIVGDLIKCRKCGNSLAGSSVLPAGDSGAWGVQCTRWRMDGEVKVAKCHGVLNSFTAKSLWAKAGQTQAALAYAAELSAAASAILRARGGVLARAAGKTLKQE